MIASNAKLYFCYWITNGRCTILRDDCLPGSYVMGGKVYPVLRILSYTGPDYALSIAEERFPEYRGALSVKECHY